MTTWYDQLTRIRRFLRDPSGNIWTDNYLKTLYNDVQRDLQIKTYILEDVQALRVPQLYQFSYMFDWEWRYLPSTQSQFYQCLKLHHQSGWSLCYQWEAQELTGISSDVGESYHQFTHPWEQFLTQTGEPHQMRFPKNFHKMKYIAYDKDPISPTTHKKVSNGDSSYKTKQGVPYFYYRPDELENNFVLYPNPTVATWLDEPGGGMALFEEDDVLNQEVGTVVVRQDTYLSSNVGIAIDIVDADDSVFMIYSYDPTEVNDTEDESDYPVFLRKYVEHGVLARAFRANTDGRTPSLAQYWERRYNLGISFIKRFKIKRSEDRELRLATQGRDVSRGRPKHGRLPSHYPEP